MNKQRPGHNLVEHKLLKKEHTFNHKNEKKHIYAYYSSMEHKRNLYNDQIRTKFQ